MPWFRPPRSASTPLPSDPFALAPVLTDLWRPGQFYLGHGLKLAWQFETETTLPWEAFRGHLLDERHARQTRVFLAWNLLRVEGRQVRTEAPLVSLLLDAEARSIHITRSLFCLAWQARPESETVDGEETERWVRELIGTVALDDVDSIEALRDELICRIGQAIAGTSRLPLTSPEAPLPDFSLGRLAYACRSDLAAELRASPMLHWRLLLAYGWTADLASFEEAKLLETLLRTIGADEVDAFADAFAERWETLGRAPTEPAMLLRKVFEEVSLSPYTEFVDRTLAWVERLGERAWLDRDATIDFPAWLLRQLCRHLTAYDLVDFHYRGANYPDALVVDAALRSLLRHSERSADAFRGDGRDVRLRRRALRQAWIVRRGYEGHLVPDVPTSPGDAARIMPEALASAPKEQIEHPLKRRRRLFAEAPSAALAAQATAPILREALLDLANDAELAELGTATFIDRPFGWDKPPAEPDLTPIVAHEAFSRSIALRRLETALKLAAECGDALRLPDDFGRRCRSRVEELGRVGIRGADIAIPPRPMVSLADMRRVADDFVVVRTMPGSLAKVFPLLPSTLGSSHEWRWLLRREPGELVLLRGDGTGLVLRPDASRGFVQRARVEWPRAGVRCDVIS